MTAPSPSRISPPQDLCLRPFQALKDINLEIRHGEIFALLGPNGAGKTTLISIICGIVNPSAAPSPSTATTSFPITAPPG
jgi:ABC-type Mn2+/Zn2+ transport system ATPase subunit